MAEDFKPVNIVNVDGETVELNIMTAIGTDEGEINAQSFSDEIRAINLHGGFSGITAFINGPGGSVIQGLGMFHAIRNSEIPVTTHITGVAASMHGILAFAGKKILMNDFARLMIHKPHNDTDVDPDPEEQKAIAALTESLVTILVARTGKTVAQINKMLDSGDTWLSAKEALEGGFIDEIVKAKKHRNMDLAAIAASFQPSKNYNGTNLSNILSKAIDDKETTTLSRLILVNRISAKTGIDADHVERILKGTKKVKTLSMLEAFASELDLQITSIKQAAGKDNMRYDSKGNLLDQNTKIINMEQLAVFVGLNKEASEQSIIDAVKAIMGERETAVSDLGTRTTELKTANETVEAQTTEIKAFKDAADLLNKEQLDVTLDQAVKEGKIEQKDVAGLKDSFKDNLPGLQMVFKTLKTKAPNINAQLNGGGNGSDGGDGETPTHLSKEQKDMNYREWDKNDHKGLKALLKSNPDYVKGLYKAKYDKEMSDALITQLS